jgi:hypothetical protein
MKSLKFPVDIAKHYLTNWKLLVPIAGQIEQLERQSLLKNHIQSLTKKF